MDNTRYQKYQTLNITRRGQDGTVLGGQGLGRVDGGSVGTIQIARKRFARPFGISFPEKNLKMQPKPKLQAHLRRIS